jgi:hypothetical protein
VIVTNTLTVITLIVNVTAHDSIGTHCETLTVIVTSIVTLTITLTVIVTVIFTPHRCFDTDNGCTDNADTVVDTNTIFVL